MVDLFFKFLETIKEVSLQTTFQTVHLYMFNNYWVMVYFICWLSMHDTAENMHNSMSTWLAANLFLLVLNCLFKDNLCITAF